MSEDTMLDQAIKDIVSVMTSLAGLKSILEDRREDKPEEGKVYNIIDEPSRPSLASTGKWSESEVEPYTQEIDVFDIDYDEEDLFADIK